MPQILSVVTLAWPAKVGNQTSVCNRACFRISPMAVAQTSRFQLNQGMEETLP